LGYALVALIRHVSDYLGFNQASARSIADRAWISAARRLIFVWPDFRRLLITMDQRQQSGHRWPEQSCRKRPDISSEGFSKMGRPTQYLLIAADG
jgi:hypothetical protein